MNLQKCTLTVIPTFSTKSVKQHKYYNSDLFSTKKAEKRSPFFRLKLTLSRTNLARRETDNEEEYF